jgi:hypothetical protein
VTLAANAVLEADPVTAFEAGARHGKRHSWPLAAIISVGSCLLEQILDAKLRVRGVEPCRRPCVDGVVEGPRRDLVLTRGRCSGLWSDGGSLTVSNRSHHETADEPMISLNMVRHTVLVAAICVLVGSVVEAQTTGGIEGSLVDGRGLPVAGITVTARHLATDTPYRVTTNDLGRYRFTTLPPGTYEVTTAASPSLGPGILTVKVTIGASTTSAQGGTSMRVTATSTTGSTRSTRCRGASRWACS